jgi:hypothetical protein
VQGSNILSIPKIYELEDWRNCLNYDLCFCP